MKKRITLDEFIKEMRNGNCPKRIKVIDQCGKKWNLQWANIPKAYVITDDFYKQANIVFGASLADTYVEYYEEILDEAEKKYLSNVIKPFRNKVKFIRTARWVDYDRYIEIIVNIDSGSAWQCSLPLFNEKSMYTGMEVEKCYSLEELGI